MFKARGGRGGVRMSASKDILEKLGRDHQLPLVSILNIVNISNIF